MSQVLEKQLFTVDDAGRIRIAGTRIQVAQIALEATRQGRTPEQIVSSHSHLSLEQVHAALAYYYGHQKVIEAQIRASLAYADKAQQEAEPSVLAAKLKAAKRSVRQPA